MIRLHKINNEKVTPVKYIDESQIDKRPLKGEALFTEIYANIFIVAKKKSGKTTVINKIVKGCTTTDTTVLVFSATAQKDIEHLNIKKYCKDKGIPYQAYTSMDEDGVNILDTLILKLQQDAEDEQASDDEEEDSHPPKKDTLILFESSDEEDDKDLPKKRKNKYKSPEYLIIFDDLSNELKSKILTKFLKMNRHWRAKVIVSTQYPNDLLPESIKQMDYALIFKGEHDEKLLKLHKDLDLAIKFDVFKKIYLHATQDKYHFLYVDVRNEMYRRDFTHVYDINNLQ